MWEGSQHRIIKHLYDLLSEQHRISSKAVALEAFRMALDSNLFFHSSADQWHGREQQPKAERSCQEPREKGLLVGSPAPFHPSWVNALRAVTSAHSRTLQKHCCTRQEASLWNINTWWVLNNQLFPISPDYLSFESSLYLDLWFSENIVRENRLLILSSPNFGISRLVQFLLARLNELIGKLFHS